MRISDWSSDVCSSDLSVQAVAAGSGHSMMLKTDGSLWMVGFDGGGQLGDGGNINRKPPFPLRSGICAISAGSFHSLILDEHAKLWAFGYNGSGQPGRSEERSEGHEWASKCRSGGARD